MMTRWALLVLLVLLPTAAAQINGPMAFEADYGFSDPSTAAMTTVLSGRMEVETGLSTGPFGFFDAVGMRIDGLDKVCRPALSTSCITGDLSLLVDDGGSAGLKFWTGVGAEYEAEHALALFLDARGDDLNSLTLNQSLLAPAVDGRMTFGDIPGLPNFAAFGAELPEITLSPTSADTRLLLLDQGQVVAEWTGKSGLYGLYGLPQIPTFATDFVVLPFKDGSLAQFTAADAEAARQGLDFQRLETVFQKLEDASATSTEGGADDVGDSPLEDTLSEVLDAALIRFPSSNGEAPSGEFELVLFDSFAVENAAGGLDWEGEAAFQMHGTEVAGAQDLYGFWFFQLPWWGWLLWVVATGLFIARMVVKPDPRHPRWDPYRWIGWVAGVFMFVLVFFLWDLEMRTVWGTSVLTTDTTGTAFWITFGIQLGTMALVLGAVSWPLSIIIKNTLLLSRQGNFMGLGKPISMVLAYVLGATLLLAYIELILVSVIENLPS